jgi:hypothetical protein
MKSREAIRIITAIPKLTGRVSLRFHINQTIERTMDMKPHLISSIDLNLWAKPHTPGDCIGLFTR